MITLPTTPRVLVTPGMRKRVFARDGQECQYCGSTTAERYELAHVIPASRGGPATAYNLVVSCKECNRAMRRQTLIPRNLDTITASFPDWRRVVIKAAQRATKQ